MLGISARRYNGILRHNQENLIQTELQSSLVFFIKYFIMFQAFVGTGFNLLLNYDTSTNFNPAHRQSDFDREPGKVSKMSQFLRSE